MHCYVEICEMWRAKRDKTDEEWDEMDGYIYMRIGINSRDKCACSSDVNAFCVYDTLYYVLYLLCSHKNHKSQSKFAICHEMNEFVICIQFDFHEATYTDQLQWSMTIAIAMQTFLSHLPLSLELLMVLFYLLSIDGGVQPNRSSEPSSLSYLHFCVLHGKLMVGHAHLAQKLM